MAMQLMADARLHNNRAGEARALTILGRALFTAGRTSEGRYICRQSEVIAHELGNPDIQDQAPTVLDLNLKMLEEPETSNEEWRDLLVQYEETAKYMTFESARADKFYESGSRRRIYHFGGERLVVELAFGFVTLKFLGPFIEAFAAKLGERLGESTADAIARIRLLRNRKDDRKEMDIVLTGRTTLLLPEDFTDEARLATIELDVTDLGVRGAVLHWDSVTGKWLPAPIADLGEAKSALREGPRPSG